MSASHFARLFYFVIAVDWRIGSNAVIKMLHFNL